MKRFFRNFDSLHFRSTGGQTLIILALMFVMLIGFVGLVVDVGQVYIQMGHLRRAVDAGALSAAAQFREGRGITDMTPIATEVIRLNGVNPTYVNVEDCGTTPSLCPTSPRRKFVRVTASADVPLTFMQVLGLSKIGISSNAVAEAASLDVVLVIDISESMAWDAPVGDPLRDPHACNEADPTGADGYPGECEPFEHVKAAADHFVQRILDKSVWDEEDRLAIVTFANGWMTGTLGTTLRTTGWTNDRAVARDIVRNLSVFEPGECYYPGTYTQKTFWGPCRPYDLSGTYSPYGFDCLSCRDAGDGNGPKQDWSSYTTTNIGGGLRQAGNMFSLDTRQEAVWVVVLLTDGMANATDTKAGDDIQNYSTYPTGYCPNNRDRYDPDQQYPLCEDHDVSTRHKSNDANYDADDYARDMADFVGCLSTNPAPACGGLKGQGALMYSIGLGGAVLDTSNEIHGRPYGANLLRYIAAVGDDGDPATDPCVGLNPSVWCGNYYFGAQGNDLDLIFEDIASRIFTRLNH